MVDFLMIERFMVIDCFRYGTQFPLGLFHVEILKGGKMKNSADPLPYFEYFYFFTTPFQNIYIFVAPANFPQDRPDAKKTHTNNPHAFLSDY